MSLIDTNIREFTELLASPAAVPGGGGASALVGAVGIALGDMVGELTVGKKKYADVEEDIKALMARAQDLRVRLTGCIQKDADLFEPLSKAYGLPKDTPGRAEIMEKCLRDAASAPLEILDLCCEAIEVIEEFAAKGSRLVLSDAATGAMFCHGAIYGAAVNVRVNTKLMKDRGYAEKTDRHVEEMMAEYLPRAMAVYAEVTKTICS